MIQTLVETPGTYRLTAAEMAAPVPRVEAVLFDFSNTIFQMIDLGTWLRRVGAITASTGEQPGQSDGTDQFQERSPCARRARDRSLTAVASPPAEPPGGSEGHWRG